MSAPNKTGFMISRPMFVVDDQSPSGKLRFGDVIDLPPGPALIWHQLANRKWLAEWIQKPIFDLVKKARKTRSINGNSITLGRLGFSPIQKVTNDT